MNTRSSKLIRVLLYECAHKPNFTAMTVPQKGQTITCFACNQPRTVVGMQTGWALAEAHCKGCKWSIGQSGFTRKKIVTLSQRHANARDHRVEIVKDGYTLKIKPAKHYQPPLIDDLLLLE